MDDRDAIDLRTRLVGVDKGLRRLNILASTYQAGQLRLVNLVLTLTNAQKTAIQTNANDLAGRIDLAVANLETPTGQVGTIDTKVLTEIQAMPAKINNRLSEIAQQLAELIQGHEEVIATDGTTRITFPVPVAQAVANETATLKAGVLFVTGVERLKLV